MLVAILYRQHPLPKIWVPADSHLMLSKHINSVCKSAFFSVSKIGRIGKYLDRDKCFLLYLKLKLSFMTMGTHHSLPGPLDFGMHYQWRLRILNHSTFLRVKLEDSCSVSAIEYERSYYCRLSRLLLSSLLLLCIEYKQYWHYSTVYFLLFFFRNLL